jgi:predicted DCC family thiol-disulfide oxidoreductase YuxK
MAQHRAMQGHILIYDGDCAFCTLWVNRLRDWLPAFPPTQTSQSAPLEALGLNRDDVEKYAWYITPTHQYAGHLAGSALLRAQPRVGLRVLGALIALPPLSWVAGVVYWLVARFRHRLPGGTPSCDPGLPQS